MNPLLPAPALSLLRSALLAQTVNCHVGHVGVGVVYPVSFESSIKYIRLSPLRRLTTVCKGDTSHITHHILSSWMAADTLDC